MKKESQQRKLRLSRETLRRLTDRDLARAVGGGGGEVPTEKTCTVSNSVGGYGGGTK